MYRNNKNGKILNVLLGLITFFIVIFIIAFIANKNRTKYLGDDKTFDNNMNSMQDVAKTYFANDLPENIGDTKIITLDEMYEKDLINHLSYGKASCDETLSYISITKANNTEYKVKSNLVCGNKSDSRIEKITHNTVINDDNGNVIIDERNGDVITDVDKTDKNGSGNSSNGSSNDYAYNTYTFTSSKGEQNQNNAADSSYTRPANCTGPICRVVIAEVDCNTTYSYEYVKRHMSCPAGYNVSGASCVRSYTDTVNATPTYTNATTRTEPAKQTGGSSYKEYANPIPNTTPGETHCENGTLENDGFCYDYKNKEERNNPTYECDTANGYNYDSALGKCVKYAAMIGGTNPQCPSGYTEHSDGYCYLDDGAVDTYYDNCNSGDDKLDNNGNCRTYGRLIKGNDKCPDGYWENPNSNKASNACMKTEPAETTPAKCDSGYTESRDSIGNRICVKSYDANTRTISKCPDGFYENANGECVKQGPRATEVYSCDTNSEYNILDGKYCFSYKNINTTKLDCTAYGDGYVLSSDGLKCIKTTSTITNKKSCSTLGNGWIANGEDYCSKYECPSGYNEDNTGKCVKTDTKYNEEVVCPSGYTPEYSGSKLLCYVKAKSNADCSKNYDFSNPIKTGKWKIQQSYNNNSEYPTGTIKDGNQWIYGKVTTETGWAGTTYTFTYYKCSRPSYTYYCSNKSDERTGQKCYTSKRNTERTPVTNRTVVNDAACKTKGTGWKLTADGKTCYKSQVRPTETKCANNTQPVNGKCIIDTKLLPHENSCPVGYNANPNYRYGIDDPKYACYKSINASIEYKCTNSSFPTRAIDENGNYRCYQIKQKSTISERYCATEYTNDSRKLPYNLNESQTSCRATYRITESSQYCTDGSNPKNGICTYYSRKYQSGSSYCENSNYIKDELNNRCYHDYRTSSHTRCNNTTDVIIGNRCYIKRDKEPGKNATCPTGFVTNPNYTSNSDRCISKRDANVRNNITYVCPTNYTERAGITGNINACKKQVGVPVNSGGQTTYSCPSTHPYTEGSGASLRCYTLKQNAGSYYCEDSSAELRGTTCYITISSQFSGYTCPNGYTPSANNTCTGTKYEYATPIWTEVDRTYSDNETLYGYQRTGKTKYITKCTPVEKPHYK